MKRFKTFILKGSLFLISLFVVNFSFAHSHYLRNKEINSTDRDGRTVLHTVIIENDTETLNCVLDLINKNADLNIKDNQGLTPLLYASESGNNEVVVALIENRAN
ncbi:MAG: ankyrin repeat domain-containing protein [Bdellovibrionales bacterium]|nr:ankyrin repeat domain-containing protein [Bdellovibrionales bacterium]